MAGKFFKDGNTCFFVVKEPQFEDDTYQTQWCDGVCLSMWPGHSDVLPDGAEVGWEKVPRSFLVYCLTRWPRLFEAPEIKRNKKIKRRK